MRWMTLPRSPLSYVSCYGWTSSGGSALPLMRLRKSRNTWSMTPGRMSTNSHRMARKRMKGALCPNVPLLRHIDRLSHDPNIAELMDYVAGGLTLFERLHQGECWDRQPEWFPATALDESEFFHTQRRPRHECNQDTTDVMTTTPVWHFSKSFCKNEMRPSSQVHIRHRLRGKSAMSPLPIATRA